MIENITNKLISASEYLFENKHKRLGQASVEEIFLVVFQSQANINHFEYLNEKNMFSVFLPITNKS